jgi:hypothetical protein
VSGSTHAHLGSVLFAAFLYILTGSDTATQFWSAHISAKLPGPNSLDDVSNLVFCKRVLEAGHGGARQSLFDHLYKSGIIKVANRILQKPRS